MDALLQASRTVYVLTTLIGQVPVGVASELVRVKLASAVQLSEIATPKASKVVMVVTAAGNAEAEQPLTSVLGIVPEITGLVLSIVLLIV